MNPRAVEKARSRIRVAEKALSELVGCPDYASFTDTWYTFLVAAKNVYTALEQGAKSSAQSRQWFGAIKEARRNDELLQYLFQARDDDEHGLNEITRLEGSSVGIGKGAHGYSNNVTVHNLRIENGQIINCDVESNDGKPVLIETRGPRAVLSPIIGRGPVIYQPPTKHEGIDIQDRTPLGVATLGLAYLSTLVDKAATLA